MVREIKVHVNRRSQGGQNVGRPPTRNIDTIDLSQLSSQQKEGFDEKNLISTVWKRNTEGHYTLLVRTPEFRTAWKGTIRERKDGNIAIVDVEKNHLGHRVGVEEFSAHDTRPIVIEEPEKKAIG